jgi:hypothetical protein
MTKKEIIEILKREVDWHKKTERTMPDDWCDGFIDGLEQAIKVIKICPSK